MAVPRSARVGTARGDAKEAFCFGELLWCDVDVRECASGPHLRCGREPVRTGAAASSTRTPFAGRPSQVPPRRSHSAPVAAAADVRQRSLCLRAGQPVQRTTPIGGVTHHHDVIDQPQIAAQPLAHHTMVIDHQDADQLSPGHAPMMTATKAAPYPVIWGPRQGNRRSLRKPRLQRPMRHERPLLSLGEEHLATPHERPGRHIEIISTSQPRRCRAVMRADALSRGPALERDVGAPKFGLRARPRLARASALTGSGARPGRAPFPPRQPGSAPSG
jgi:hypothetical protein